MGIGVASFIKIGRYIPNPQCACISLVDHISFSKMVAPLIPVAMEALARATSTSEVLTLNLTNLLILIVLKALIFGFGIVFAGSGSTARSSDETGVTETELTAGMCFMLYTSGDDSKLSCVQRAACEDSDMADQYQTAGKMWLKMHKIIGLDFSEKYLNILNSVNDASEYSKMGGDCSVYPW